MGRPKKEALLSNAERKRKWREGNKEAENEERRKKRQAKKEQMSKKEKDELKEKERIRKAIQRSNPKQTASR